jgi:hypothetical protein
MWINNSMSKPLRKGNYKTLVDFDGLGNLSETKYDYFNGVEWDIYSSYGQHISYWWAEKEDYETLSEMWDKEI